MTSTNLADLPQVAGVLRTLLDRVRETLQNQFVGMYLYGSLSSGDFDDASSDIDFLVVTKSELSSDQFHQLGKMHADFKSSDVPFADRLEGSYIPAAAIRRYDPTHSEHASVGVDWEFGMHKHGWTWVLERANILQSNLAFAGPPPSTLIDPVGPEEVKSAVRHVLHDFWENIGQPDWLQVAAYQAFAILTMCRALYTLNSGQLATKPQAAQWASDDLGDPWRDHIAWALQHRHDFSPHDPTMAHAFIAYVLELARDR